MSIRTKRWKTRLGASAVAASLVAGAFGISPAGAALTDPDDGNWADIRVTPGSETNSLYQPAPVIFPGNEGQEAAGMQLFMPDGWNAGDRLLVQLFDSNNDNCASPAQSMGFAGTPTVTVDGAYVLASGDATDTSNPAADLIGADQLKQNPWITNTSSPTKTGVDNLVKTTDPRLTGYYADITDEDADDIDLADFNVAPTPTFTTTLLSSNACDNKGVKDIVAITFTNTAAPKQLTIPNEDFDDQQPVDEDNPATVDIDFAVWAFDISGVSVDVADQVAAGPVHAVPYAQSRASGAGTGYLNTENLFGGNLSTMNLDPSYDTDAAGLGDEPIVNVWTNPAFISPVKVEAETQGNRPLPADGSTQQIGKFTISTTDGSALLPGTYKFNVGGDDIGNVVQSTVDPASKAALDGNGDPIKSGSSDGDFEFALNATNTSAVTVEIAGEVWEPNNHLALTFQPFSDNPLPPGYLNLLRPDDGGQHSTLGSPDSNSKHSDVELAALSGILLADLGQSSELPERIGGADRTQTAAKIAVAGAYGECIDYAVLVNGWSPADALTASYLAGALAQKQWFGDGDGSDFVPILTTQAGNLSPDAQMIIREYGVKTVYILGGTAAVNANVEAQVQALQRTRCGDNLVDGIQTVQTKRVAGANRYATNYEANAEAQSLLITAIGNSGYNARIRYQAGQFGPSKRTALVVAGGAVADALSVGPAAYGDYSDGFPLILTDSSTLSASAAQLLNDIDIDQVVVVGGTAAVSAAVQAQIDSRGIDVIRLAGADRYETNAVVNRWLTDQPEAGDPYVNGLDLLGGWALLANGTTYADALAGAPLAAVQGTPIVLVEANSLPDAARDFLTNHSWGHAIALGLGSAINTSVIDAANAALAVPLAP